MGKLAELPKYRLSLKPVLDKDVALLQPSTHLQHRSSAAAGSATATAGRQGAPTQARPAHRRKMAVPVRSQVLV